VIIMSLDLTPPRSAEPAIIPAPPPGAAGRGRRPMPWFTVTALAVAVAFADGFWRTSLQGAVGSTERAQGPFVTWLWQSALLVPVFGLAVLTALVLARRWFGPVLRGPKRVLAAALLIVLAGSLVGIGSVAVNSAYDYYLQSRELRTTQATHFHALTGNAATANASCNATCQAERSTLSAHARALGYSSPVILGSNLVLVGWVLAMCGGRLEAAPIRRRRMPVTVS
jgi:hypothetical protein